MASDKSISQDPGPSSWGCRRLAKWSCLTLLGLLTIAILTLFIAVRHLFSDLPSCATLETCLPASLQNHDGQLIALPNGGFVKIFAADRMHESIVAALVAAEDFRFFSFKGFDSDWLKFCIILVNNKKYRADGIPGQTARMILEWDHPDYSTEPVLIRNFREIIFAHRIEQCLDKRQILWLYANLVYLGHGRSGFGAASEFYFGKPVDELSLGEAALLAGIIPAPDKYSPIRDLNAAKQRQRIVIRKMVVEEHRITPQEGEEALNQPLVIKTPD